MFITFSGVSVKSANSKKSFKYYVCEFLPYLQNKHVCILFFLKLFSVASLTLFLCDDDENAILSVHASDWKKKVKCYDRRIDNHFSTNDFESLWKYFSCFGSTYNNVWLGQIGYIYKCFIITICKKQFKSLLYILQKEKKNHVGVPVSVHSVVSNLYGF